MTGAFSEAASADEAAAQVDSPPVPAICVRHHGPVYSPNLSQRYRLQIAARGIQLACAAQLVERMNELTACGCRENLAKIDHLSRALLSVRNKFYW